MLNALRASAALADGGWCAFCGPGVGAQAGHRWLWQPDERRHGGRLTVDWGWQGTRPVILSGLECRLPETRLPKCGLGVFYWFGVNITLYLRLLQ